MNLKMKMKQLNKLPIPIKRAMSINLAAKHPVFWNNATGMIEPVMVKEAEVVVEQKKPRKRKKAAKKD